MDDLCACACDVLVCFAVLRWAPRTLLTDVGYSNTVALGQYFVTRPGEKSLGKAVRNCKEFTATNENSPEPNVTSGPVAERAAKKVHARYGMDFYAPSTCGIGEVWITVCRGNAQCARHHMTCA